MSLILMYITNDENVAKIAEDSGVDWIFIDLEVNGKDERQGHLDTVISRHSVEDIKKIKRILKHAKLLVRINPIFDGTEGEINAAIDAGADILMLPFFTARSEAEQFVGLVNGRVKTCLLVETPEAVRNIDAILSVEGINYVHIGLNDLHLAYQMNFIFELLTDGTVDMLCQKFKEKHITYGFGGVAQIGQGTLPAEYIVGEHYRLGSSMVILSRSFCNTKDYDDIACIRNIFTSNVARIRAYERKLLNKDTAFFIHNHDVVLAKVGEITHRVMPSASRRIPMEELRAVVHHLLMVNQLKEKDASIIADCIIEADACGVSTHGVSVLPAHIKKLQSGGYNTDPKFTVVREGGAFAVIDGDNAVGSISAVHCMEYAIDKSREAGIFTVFSCHCNTYGPSFYYPMQAAKVGIIGITFCNSPAAMAPWRGKDKLLGTNPFAIVVPCQNESPVIFDMATSKVAKSKINEARIRQREIPSDWALDVEGNPTTDPIEAIKGLILPMEEHKGYGLSLTIDILAGVLSGAAFLDGVGKFYSESNRPMDVGQVFIAIDPVKVYGKAFNTVMDSYVEKVYNSSPIGLQKVRVPGQNKMAKKRDSEVNGIELSAKTIELLNQCLRECGIDTPL